MQGYEIRLNNHQLQVSISLYEMPDAGAEEMATFEEMSVFVAVCEEEGFAAAARRLNLSAPAVTRAIAALEKRIGTVLLMRNTRSTRLTEAGRRYYHDCRRILQDIQDAADGAIGHEQAPRGTLTITAPVLFGERFVVPIVIEFLKAYPQVNVRTLLVDRVLNLHDEQVDVAIRIAPLTETNANAELVGEVQRMVCAAPALLERDGIPLTPGELGRFRLIHASAVGDWNFLVNGQPFRLELQTPLIVNSNQAAIAAAVDGFGVTRVISYQIADQLAAGKLNVLLGEFALPPVPIHVICPRDRRISTRTQRFVEFCSARLRSHPALH